MVLLIIIILSFVILCLALDFFRYADEMQHKNIFTLVCGYAKIRSYRFLIISSFIFIDFILIYTHLFQQPQQISIINKNALMTKEALPGFPWVADLLMSFPEGTNEGYGPIFSDSRADRALVC